MDNYVSLDKRSKKARREYYAAQRRTWGNVNPVTKSVESEKIYDRKKEKRKAGREFRDEFDAGLCVLYYTLVFTIHQKEEVVE